MSTINSRERIVIVKNQTTGGGDRYSKNVIDELQKKYTVDFFEPDKFEFISHTILNKIFHYLVYVYFYLPKYYEMIGIEINQAKQYQKIIVFQDAYRKSPDIFQTLKKKSAYILHEPPREFYEPLRLHVASFKDRLFTYLLRWPIFFSDRRNTQKSTIIVSNSLFSRDQIKRIYNKDSFVIYPGYSQISSLKLKRKNQCLSMGSLLPYKGHELAIKSIGLIKDNRPSLLIIGQGKDSCRNRLISCAKKHSVDLKIIPYLSDKELWQIYTESKVYINAGFQEPFGMTSLEAIGNGCNLVTVKNCGTEELKKHFSNKVMVTKRSSLDIANAITKSMSTDNSKPPMNEFSWGTVASEIIALISQ